MATRAGARQPRSRPGGRRDQYRSRAGVQAVFVALLILALTAAAQSDVFVATGSVALLADPIRNAGDAATAIRIAIAFAARKCRRQRRASGGTGGGGRDLPRACVAGYEAAARLIDPRPVTDLGALALAGVIGVRGQLERRGRCDAGPVSG